MTTSNACRLCRAATLESDTICHSCKRAHGPRVASTLARALADSSFQSACLASLPHDARERFAQALLQSYLSRETREAEPASSQHASLPRLAKCHPAAFANRTRRAG
jgi:hypothetical protein